MALSEGRGVTFASGDLALEGLLHLPDGVAAPLPGIVVCHPHPQYVGDMRNNVVGALCQAALDEGMAALRFNFRGAGTSSGSFDRGRGEQDDVRAALAHLATLPEVDAARLALAGYSFGAAMALPVAASGADVRALVAVSTPTGMSELPPLPAGLPALFASGDRDEYSDPAVLRDYVAALPTADLRVFPGVDHFWWGSADRLIEAVREFLGSAPGMWRV